MTQSSECCHESSLEDKAGHPLLLAEHKGALRAYEESHADITFHTQAEVEGCKTVI